MRQATTRDKSTVIKILSESFEENKSVLSVVGYEKSKIPKLIAYSFEKGIKDGEVWLNDKRTATLIVLYPHRARYSFQDIMLGTKLLFSVIGPSRLFKILKREKTIKAKQPKSDFIHLWYIGVLNKYQNKGEGSQILKEFLELKKRENTPIYLETTSIRKEIG